MSDFQPPAPTYRQQVSKAWEWWKSTAYQPQLWGVYVVLFVPLALHPNPSALFLGELARPVGILGAFVSMLMVLHNWPRRSQARGQLTIPDLVYFGAGFLILALFAQPIYELLNQQASELGAGSAYLLQMVVPGLAVTMLIILFAIASGGGQ